MRRITINKWIAKTADGSDVEESIMTVLSFLISNKKPEEIPRGLDKFRLFNRLAKAFEKAESSQVLELEEADYAFLKKSIENDIPSTFAMNKNINEAVESFMNAKEE